MALSITLADASLGAEIRGVDSSQDVDAETFAAIRRAVDERGVIVLREQGSSPADMVRFAERFGRLLVHAHNKYALPEAPAVTVISNIVENGRNIGVPDAGLVWHTDGSYLVQPDMYSFLHAIEVPHEQGEPLGTTYYASAVAATTRCPKRCAVASTACGPCTASRTNRRGVPPKAAPASRSPRSCGASTRT